MFFYCLKLLNVNNFISPRRMQKALHAQSTACSSVISADSVSRSSKGRCHVPTTHFKERHEFKRLFSWKDLSKYSRSSLLMGEP